MGPTSDCYDYSCRENLQIVHIVFFIHAKEERNKEKKRTWQRGFGNVNNKSV